MAIDAQTFRKVLGHFPTGVAVITAVDRAGAPVGMAVGSFTSVSLEPPLVAFLPDKTSTSFPRIREAGSFCVNILADDQESVCRAFATKGADKFAGISWRPAPSGAPLLGGALGWIDCDIDTIHDAGDHYIVIGRVNHLQAVTASSPLLFFKGGYGKLSSPSLSAPAEPDLLEHLRALDTARDGMTALAAELDVECLAIARIRDEIVIVGSAGRPRHPTTTRIGQRSPFAAPLGALFVPDDAAEQEKWLARAGVTTTDHDHRDRFLAAVARARGRGWSIVLHTPSQRRLESTIGRSRPPEGLSAVRAAIGQLDPDAYEPEIADGTTYSVSSLSAPIRGADGEVILAFSLYGLRRPTSFADITRYRDRLIEVTTAVTATLGRPVPDEMSEMPYRRAALVGSVTTDVSAAGNARGQGRTR